MSLPSDADLGTVRFRPPTPIRKFQGRKWLHALLFLLTLYTTTYVGALHYLSYASDFGRRNAHVLQHRDRATARFPPIHFLVKANRLLDLIAYGIDRIQGGHGLLEHHRDLVASNPPHALRAHSQKILAPEQDSPSLDAPRRR